MESTTNLATKSTVQLQSEALFPLAWREGVYQAIYRRRDIRRFRPDPIPPAILARLLDAAHHAPSVGFMQPWTFLVISERQTRLRVQDLFERERLAASHFFDEPEKSHYLSLKLAGILDAPLNLCVTCDPTRVGPTVLGRNSIPETDLYSTCCAIENFWLAARAEGLGVGWVSILKLPQLRAILGIPPHVIPVAYLCVGYPEAFSEQPELEQVGWRARLPLASVIAYERWGQTEHPAWIPLHTLLASPSTTIQTSGSITPLLAVAARIQPLDTHAMQAARTRQANLTKPQGSLGLLEEVSIQLAGITRKPCPRFSNKAVIILAADHGVATEGVSAYPQAVTAQMVQNFLAGRAAINVLARQAGARVVVADVGVCSDLPTHPQLLRKKIGYGTRSMTQGAAMSQQDALTAIMVGIEIVQNEVQRRLDLLAIGEMGIGNTTAASAIVAALTGRPVTEVTGRGTGIDEAGWKRKVACIEQALQLNRPNAADPLDVVAKVGGYEIAGLVGVILGAASSQVPVIIDGFIASTAALIATELCPQVRSYLIAPHSSVEIGHQVVLERMELRPLLNLNLRLGEGTGAVLAMHLLDNAVTLLSDMATFEEAGVAKQVAIS